MNAGEPTEQRERAANAYVVWPLAALALAREEPDASAWLRIHSRQAFVFGIVAALAYLVLLALPLLVVIAVPALGPRAVVWLYAVGILADLAGAVAWLALCLVYRARAARGELFAIPLVTALADRLLARDSRRRGEGTR